MSALKEKYLKQIVPEMQKHFNLTSIMQVTKLEKVVINKGLGAAVQDSKLLDSAIDELLVITGQKPLVTKAKKSIATYKLRQGQGIGCKVTLRGERMWAFVETLFNIALPRVRDFRGISTKSFDGRGNYTLGVKEQIIFPQIVYDNVKKVSGFDITFVTSNNDEEQAKYLLRALGAPLQKNKGDK